MTKSLQPRITLVGAGPGDPELITVKGLKALKAADVVLYDALAGEELLEFVPKSAMKVYVGKRASQHRYSQSEINQLMVQYALLHGHVVRLKGGDPFVFGRGHEELEFARPFNIQVEVIPGISSSIAAAELQEIPVTRRGINESFWVMTGTTRSGKLSDDIKMAAQSSATVIILMGMRKLKEIAAIFADAGKNDTPVIVVQNSSRKDEKKVLGKVNNIIEKVAEAGLGAPGVIIIGEVVGLHSEFDYSFAEPTKVLMQS